MDKPRRRYELELKLGADDFNSIIGALNSIIFDLEHGEPDRPHWDMVSGGYSSGYSLEMRVDPSITHESWEAVLNAYLEAKQSLTK